MRRVKVKKHILVVDDDRAIRDSLKRYLNDHDFQAHCAPDGGTMNRLLAKHTFDLVILDLMLSGEDGLALARQIRGKSDLPIIMLTGKGDEIDRIIGLEMGADDYLPKPYNPRELLARIKSVLRRADKTWLVTQDDASPGKVAHFEGWELDLAKRKLSSPKGKPIDLTSGEFDLLSAFVRHPQRVLSRERLLDYAGGHARFPFDRSVDIQVMRLRRKIEVNSQDPELIKTVRSVGYTFTPKVAWNSLAST
jgi:two-component system OmpR family response regulator